MEEECSAWSDIRTVSQITELINDFNTGLVSHDDLMKQLMAYPYQKIKASSDFAPPGASLSRRMEGWEDMPYPQPETIQELQVAVLRKQLAPEDLTAVQNAILTRRTESADGDQPGAG
jgi:hypothetical protein